MAFILFIIGFALAFMTGCLENKELVEGQKLVDAVRKEFSELESGVITVTNNNTGEIEQQMTFKYDELGILLYSLTGEENGGEYAQYCNGYETYTLQSGIVTKVAKGDTDYDSYTYDIRHPMTDEDYLYFDAGKVCESRVDNLDGGGKKIYYKYGAELISGEESLGKLQSFETVFWLDEKGKLSKLEEISVYEKDGKETTYSYRIEISLENSVGKLEKPQIIEEYEDKVTNSLPNS